MQCGCVASEHTVSVPGMSMAVLCAKFASMIKWHRPSLRGGGGSLWLPCVYQ